MLSNLSMKTLSSKLLEIFEDLALQIFIFLPKSKVIHFVTDSNQLHSIKQLERDGRGHTATYCIRGPRTKIPSDFKAFMLNASNKIQLILLLLSQWQSNKYACQLFGRQIYFVCEEKCVCLKILMAWHSNCAPLPEWRRICYIGNSYHSAFTRYGCIDNSPILCSSH